MNTPNERQAAFAAWIEIATNLRRQAEEQDRRIQSDGWRLAAMVGIPHDGCCLHNAAIDDNMTGWCANNPTRLRVAKVAKEWVETWTSAKPS